MEIQSEKFKYSRIIVNAFQNFFMDGCYVYILASKRNSTLYIGSTTHLANRIFSHKAKAIKGFTARYDVNQLVYTERCDNLQVALKREKQLKKWGRIRKIKLIESGNPTWEDLSNTFL